MQDLCAVLRQLGPEQTRRHGKNAAKTESHHLPQRCTLRFSCCLRFFVCLIAGHCFFLYVLLALGFSASFNAYARSFVHFGDGAQHLGEQEA